MARYEYRQGSSNKFWEAELDGTELTTNWGRIGTKGQSKTKQFGSSVQARAEHDKLVRQKLSKGYQRVQDGVPAAPAPAPPPPPLPHTTPVAVQAQQTTTVTWTDRGATWEAELDGHTVVTRQTFPDANAAAAAWARLRKRVAGIQAGGSPAPAPAATASAPAVPVLNDIPVGTTVVVQGSSGRPYTLENAGGVYSCTCPAWLHQSKPVALRTCKHLRAYRGDAAETARVGTQARATTTSSGAKATAPKLLLAHKWDNATDPVGWWMSEKLDGVRAYWDGTKFISRLGNEYMAPDWFTRDLPDWPLDGEIFAGRGQFQSTVSVVRRVDRGAGWKTLRYVVFDAPGHKGPFEDRIARLKQASAAGWQYAEVLAQYPCTGIPHLQTELARIEALGGEGVMLRKPGSLYVSGRSTTLLKVKSFHDAEAKVVGHAPGTGKHQGRLGALQAVLPDGTSFKIGTGFSDAERDNPPPIGAVVTFRYQELTKAGVPRFPVFLHVRTDFDWDAAVNGAPQAAPRPTGANPDANDFNPTQAAPAAAASTGGVRRLEYVDARSSKFWEVEVTDASVTTRWGRIGSAGQSKTKEYASPAAAHADADKQRQKKLAKGYSEIA